MKVKEEFVSVIDNKAKRNASKLVIASTLKE